MDGYESPENPFHKRASSSFHMKKSKKSQEEKIYGIFGDYAEESTNTGPSKALDSKNFFSFVKSNKRLYDDPKINEVKVHLAKKSEKAAQEKPATILTKDPKKKLKTVSFQDEPEIQKFKDNDSDFVSSGDEDDDEGDGDHRRRKYDYDEDNESSGFGLGSRRFANPLTGDAEAGEYYDFDPLEKFNKKNQKKKKEKQQKQREQPPSQTGKSMLNRSEQELSESFGKGFKIMQAIGYKGSGLGKNEQGIVEPIKAVKKTVLDGKQKPQNWNPQHSTAPSHDLVDDLQEELEQQGIKNVLKGSQQPTNALASKKPTIKSEPLWRKNSSQDDLIKARKEHHVKPEDLKINEGKLIRPITDQKVVDMRGEHAVFLDDYNEIKKVNNKTFQDFKDGEPSSSSMSTLLQESLMSIRSFIDKSRFNIQSLDKKRDFEKAHNLTCTYERDRLAEENAKLGASISTLERLKEKLAKIEQEKINLNAKEMLKECDEAFDISPDEYLDAKMEEIFLPYLIDKLALAIKDKPEPIKIDKHLLNLYTKLELFLQKLYKYKKRKSQKRITGQKGEDLLSEDEGDYDEDDPIMLERSLQLIRIYEESWLPTIKNYVLNDWNPKEFEELIDYIEHWKPLIPHNILEKLCDLFILPTLQKAIEAWNPTQESVGIHIWIHPWFEILGVERVRMLWKSIQMKLSKCFAGWEAKDSSALLLLRPWLTYLDRSDWENLIVRVILPKLIYMLSRDFRVNPKKQDIEPLEIFLDWVQYLPEDSFDEMIEKYVLKQIQQVAEEWIADQGHKNEEIKIWLKGWRDYLSGKTHNHSEVIEHFFRHLSQRNKIEL